MKKPIILMLLILFLAACQIEEVPTAVSAQSLLGYEVVDEQTKVIGLLEDVIVDAQSQKITYGVVVVPRAPYSYKGASVATSDLYVAVPWTQLSLNAATKQFALAGPADLLYSAPPLSDLQKTLVQGWDTAVKSYWQQNTN